MSLINQIVPKKLFEPGRIFEITPPSEGLYRYLAILFGLFIAIAIFLAFYAKRQKPIFKDFAERLFNLFLSTGIIGEFLIFSRWQGIPYLGSRLILLLLAAVFVGWGGWLLWYYLIIQPKKIEELKEKEIFEKYLPHKR